MVSNATYRGNSGEYWIYDPSLANKNVLKVTVEGRVFYEKASLPTGSEMAFLYDFNGFIWFSEDQPFPGSVTGQRSELIKISVLYK